MKADGRKVRQTRSVFIVIDIKQNTIQDCPTGYVNPTTAILIIVQTEK